VSASGRRTFLALKVQYVASICPSIVRASVRVNQERERVVVQRLE